MAVSSIGVSEDLVAFLVEREIREAQDVAGKVASGAPQDRLDACDDLRKAERLRDVVVAAGSQGLNLVLGGVLGGQKEHGALDPLRAQPPADLDSLEIGKHPVEDDQIGFALRNGRDCPAAGHRLVDVVTLVAKGRSDRVDDRRLVVDHQDPVGR